MLFRNSKPLVRFLSPVSSMARQTLPYIVKVCGISEIEAYTPKTPIFATTSDVLDSMLDKIISTAAIGQERKEGKRKRLSYIHPDNVLIKADLQAEPEVYKRLLMAAGAFLVSVEDCMTVRDKAIEILAESIDLKDKDKIAAFVDLNEKAIDEVIRTILAQLARKGCGSLEVPLGPQTVPLLKYDDVIEVYGKQIDFNKNNKLFSILQMQSVLHQIGLHTLTLGDMEVIRFTHVGRSHGLHHLVHPVMDLKDYKEINIRDVLKFYESHLGARAFILELKKEKGITNISQMTNEQIQELLERCLLFRKVIQKGDTFMSSTGLGVGTAAMAPSQILAYFNKDNYEKIDLLKEGFQYIDFNTGKLSRIPCTFEAPSKEIFAMPLPRESKMPDMVLVGDALDKGMDYRLSIDPLYRRDSLEEKPTPLLLLNSDTKSKP